MKRIITVVGARPQFIKAAALSHSFLKHSGMAEVIVHTGQHYDSDMSDVFFEELSIPRPQYHLGIGGLAQGAMTGRQIEKIEEILIDENPDAVLVYGDTNSTLAAALAAAKLHIPVAHVEAGLRSFNMRMPEEINRILTDRVSTWLFTPTDAATSNLLQENVKTGIHQVGDIMYDCALLFGERALKQSDILEKNNLEPDNFRLCTLHRQENTDDIERLRIAFDALRVLADEMNVVVPLHPRTRKILENAGLFEECSRNLKIIPPTGFLDFIRLMQAARSILTDSGGVQKEGYFHNTPVIILRDETEWMDLVDINWGKLAPPTSVDGILAATKYIETAARNDNQRPFGTGDTAKQILAILQDSFDQLAGTRRQYVSVNMANR